MDEKTNSAINLLTDALAEMTERCVEAERQRDAYSEDSDNWYQRYKEKDYQLLKATEKLADEVAEHKKTRQALQYALSPDRKGEE